MLGDKELRQLAKEIRELTDIKDPVERVRALAPLCSTARGSVRSRLYDVRGLAALAAHETGDPRTMAELGDVFNVSRQTAHNLIRDGRAAKANA